MGPFGTTQTFAIINQPQVAIMATDGIRKEPVVVVGPDGEDAIVVHHVGFLSLTWDHRAFDGAYAASFLNELRTVLETRDWDAELA
jgi:2-oxoglutarate dehydrogenase E2 component (dihydrolipoamide succinyltransferase)